jgi:hypothetical protein
MTTTPKNNVFLGEPTNSTNNAKTKSEVQEKIEQGQTNQVEENLLKSDKEIIKENTINNLLIAPTMPKRN